ncbi:phasin family protein [Thalassotalea sp. M1531]|uniref:Phasin family protein n=1 Tax=Thalassotalea algicola TaxID=2716224 RepID=A0A7Y0LA35_9GAMM|nr:phasin family protein [Thalassotalea algicola]NMP30763.1 phasin family protein [Thalassotalea algicola]
MTKIEAIKTKVNEAEDLARKIWLAGIGAYGKGFDEAQEQYEKLNTEATKLFEELVEKGEKLEVEAKDKFEAEKEKVKNNVDARVAEVRTKLGLDADDTDKKIEELSAKIDALTDAVAKLAK